MSDVVIAMDAASQMGLPAAALVDCLGAVRKRDADTGMVLRKAAQQEPYDGERSSFVVGKSLGVRKLWL